MITDERPIGVFDSGIGGLSVLRALLQALPLERFVYVADSGFAPYGERDDAHVLARSHAIASALQSQHQIKALVVACNTATAAAIAELRQAYPELPIVGIEPALKPAAQHSRTGRVGVLATRGTLNSRKFADLLDALHGTATFVLHACDGLADAIDHDDSPRIQACCEEHLATMGPWGHQVDAIDTLVLGCTHYPLVSDVIRGVVGPAVQLLDAGEPVARRTVALLDQAGLRRNQGTPPKSPLFLSTGDLEMLNLATHRWLGLHGLTQMLHAP